MADLLEAVLKALDGGLEALHVPYSYGFAIILLTVAVKTVTLPLTKKQIESSTQLQLLQINVSLGIKRICVISTFRHIRQL